jgi:hypothetical protein
MNKRRITIVRAGQNLKKKRKNYQLKTRTEGLISGKAHKLTKKMACLVESKARILKVNSGKDPRVKQKQMTLERSEVKETLIIKIVESE